MAKDSLHLLVRKNTLFFAFCDFKYFYCTDTFFTSNELSKYWSLLHILLVYFYCIYFTLVYALYIKIQTVILTQLLMTLPWIQSLLISK